MSRALGRCALAMGLLVGCDRGPDSGVDGTGVDDRLSVHSVVTSAPSAEAVAYIRAVAAVHDRAERADRAGDEAGHIAALRGGLGLPVPGGFGAGAVLRLELATALCEALAEQPDGLPAALDVLEPMVHPAKSLPLDRVTARALVTLGDTARRMGDSALAVASYARAIGVMSMLREELGS